MANKIHQMEEHLFAFFCPGCQMNHAFDGRWSFNGDYEKPTFKPSLLVRTGHHVPEHKSDSCWCTYNAEHPDDPSTFKCSVCHTFMTDGKIQFLNDCTHDLAGQTVDVPDWEE
jgi:hypothetical protein